MMLYPPMSSLLNRIDSRYLLVNVIARRSRDISEEAERNDEHLEKKPVSLAIDELARGEYTAVPAHHEEE
jgi:DNA-directed RNA polymerase subunit omega